MLFEKAHGFKIDNWAIYFPLNNTVLKEPVKKISESYALKKIHSVREQILNEKEFPMNITPLCGWCEYRGVVCPRATK